LPFSSSFRLIVGLNETLLEVMGDDVTQEQAFVHANDVLKNAVGGISDIIHIPGLVNVDFEDVKTLMSDPGKAMMGTAVAGGPDHASKATFKLSESPSSPSSALTTIRRFAAAAAHSARAVQPGPHATATGPGQRRHRAAAARLRTAQHARRLAQRPIAGGGEGGCAGEQ